MAVDGLLDVGVGSGGWLEFLHERSWYWCWGTCGRSSFVEHWLGGCIVVLDGVGDIASALSIVFLIVLGLPMWAPSAFHSLRSLAR